MKKIAVVGSINMDLVVESDSLPKKGETILGNNFFSGPGGKGANQAVAAARLGGDVTFFGSLGKDYFGSELEKNLTDERVKPFIRYDENQSTGVALINVYDDDNSIIVVSGANNIYNQNYLDQLKSELIKFDIVLFQLEINDSLVFELIDHLSANDKIIILNPAPAKKIAPSIIDKITYLTPNEHECQIIFDSQESIETLVQRHPAKLIVTCGEKGVCYYDGQVQVVPSMDVANIVDTTGAGDTFSGAFAYGIGRGDTLIKAIQFANVAAGLSITKKGAQAGMPQLSEVEKETLESRVRKP